jgi:hypothetical protein
VKVEDLRTQAQALSAEAKAQRMLRAGAISENVLKMWKGLPIEQYEQAVATRFDSQMLRAGVVWSDDELRSQFKLSDGQIALYKEFRASVDRSLTHLAVSDMVRFGGKDVEAVRQDALDAGDVDAAALILRDHLLELADKEPDRNELLIDTADRMIDKADRARDLMDHGYAPLSRFGHYTVDVIDENGERVYFGMFESAREAALMARKMRELPEGEDHPRHREPGGIQAVRRREPGDRGTVRRAAGPRGAGRRRGEQGLPDLCQGGQGQPQRDEAPDRAQGHRRLQRGRRPRAGRLRLQQRAPDQPEPAHGRDDRRGRCGDRHPEKGSKAS